MRRLSTFLLIAALAFAGEDGPSALSTAISKATVVSRPTATPVLPTLFGNHVARIVTRITDSTPLTPFPSTDPNSGATINTWRLWDIIRWREIEPGRDAYRFTDLDAYVASVAANAPNTDIVFTFGNNPTWAAKRPSENCHFSGTVPWALESIQRTSNVVTAIGNTGFNGGVAQISGVYVAGVSDASFNGAFGPVTLVTFTGGKKVTYNQTGADTGLISGSGTILRDGGCASEPNDNNDAVNFINTLTQRYCGGPLKYIELWNEPNGNIDFYTGSQASMLAFAQAVSGAARNTANCGCADTTRTGCTPGGGSVPYYRVLSPSISSYSSGNSWLTTFLNQAGALATFDVLAMHGYDVGLQPENWVTTRNPLWQTLRSTYGLTGMEMWDTESSWSNNSTLGDRTQHSYWLARVFILKAATGLDRYLWYLYDAGTCSNCWGAMYDTTNGAHVAARTWREIYKWLPGATIKHCEGHGDGSWACLLTRTSPAGYRAVAMWNQTGTAIVKYDPARFPFTQMRDLAGTKTAITNTGQITVTQAPILLETGDAF